MLRSASQKAFLSSLVVVATGSACSGDVAQSGPATSHATYELSLARVQSCSEVLDLVRAKARSKTNAAVDQVEQNIREGTTSGCIMYDAVATGAGATSSGPANTTSAPTSVSETNNQVVGVDEPDLVKTDGQYLYLAREGELLILAAWPAAELRLVARVPVGGTAKRLFLDGDRALVYASVSRQTDPSQAAWSAASSSDCTYGYDCDFSGDGFATRAVVVDLTDRAQPRIVRALDFTGSLIAARRIGHAVHTVVSVGGTEIPGLDTSYSGAYACNSYPTEADKQAAIQELEALRAKNEAIIRGATIDLGVLARENGRPLGQPDCGDFYRETSNDGLSITTVASLDLGGAQDPVLANVVTRAGAVYATADALYMAVPHQRQSDAGWYQNVTVDEASTVHQFAIGSDPNGTAYLASGLVPGRVLNQFSMDAYEGHLRIATSIGQVPDPDVSSTLSVLARHGSALDVVGQIGGIAPTEDIRSVRFDGDRGYVVTFKKTDPLFIFDLSNPAEPRQVGELLIPGFSTYLHRLDSGHLLALGYEADDQGDYAYFNGIQLQIFDVSDPAAPALLAKQVYGTRGSASSALTDHLGFTFLPDRSLLALPVTVCAGGGNGQFGTFDFSGVVALNVSVAGGITELGRLVEPEAATSADAASLCTQWWTGASSEVKRTVVLDDFLYAISPSHVRVQNLTALGTDVALAEF